MGGGGVMKILSIFVGGGVSKGPFLCNFGPSLKPHSHCADVATVHPDAGQPVYRDAPGHIS